MQKKRRLAGEVFQLKVTLDGVRPPIWRRILVRRDTRLDRFHRILQTAMGWSDIHLHAFYGEEETEYGLPDPAAPDSRGVHDERRYTISRLACEPGDIFEYEYDFGDSWMHTIRLEKAFPAEACPATPACIDGSRACPPEDVGGPGGYQWFLEAYFNPSHEERGASHEWAGEGFAPNAFDAAAVNAALSQLVQRQRRSLDKPLSGGGPQARVAQERERPPQNATSVLPFPLDELEETSENSVPAAASPSRSSEGTEASPSLEEWRRLYEAAAAFREIQPWEWMEDGTLFGVQNPEDGEVGYGCATGLLGDYIALVLYRGGGGYAAWRCLQKEGHRRKPDLEVYFMQDCLVASWESRAALDPPDLKVIKELGLKFRGSHAWPLFRSQRPGYYPWPVTGREARFLRVALEQGREIALRLRETPKLCAPKKGCLLVRTPYANQEGEGWADCWLPPEIPVLPRLQSAPDPERLQRIKASGVSSSSTWQVDRFHVASPVQDGPQTPPYFPAALMAVEPRSGLIVALDMDSPEAAPDALLNHLLDAMSSSGTIPSTIAVCRPELREMLLPLGQALGVAIKLLGSLPELGKVRRELDARLRRKEAF